MRMVDAFHPLVRFRIFVRPQYNGVIERKIYKLTGINSSSQAAKEGRFILAEDGDAIYAAEFFESGWNCGLDEAGVRDSFRLILSNWAGD